MTRLSGRTSPTPVSGSPPPSVQLPSLVRLGDFESIVVVTVDKLAVTIEIRGPERFLRRAEARLMRDVNVGLLDGRPVLLQRATWTQLEHVKLRACLPLSP